MSWRAHNGPQLACEPAERFATGDSGKVEMGRAGAAVDGIASNASMSSSHDAPITQGAYGALHAVGVRTATATSAMFGNPLGTCSAQRSAPHDSVPFNMIICTNCTLTIIRA